jgi:hypothetical protein
MNLHPSFTSVAKWDVGISGEKVDFRAEKQVKSSQIINNFFCCVRSGVTPQTRVTINSNQI